RADPRLRHAPAAILREGLNPEHRKIAVECANLVTQGGCQHGRVTSSTNQQREVHDARVLSLRHVYGWALPLSDSARHRLAGHADDCAHRAADANPLADGVLARPRTLGNSFAHDRDEHAAGDVVRVEVASSEERNTKRGEEARTYRVLVDLHGSG